MQLTGEQINEFLSKAILESQIGDVVKAAVARSLADLSKSYQNPFDAIIKRQIETLIIKEVETTYSPMLETRIKDAMAKHMTEEVVGSIIKAATDKLIRNY